MSISEKEVRHVAHLSRLALSDAEVQRYQGQLSKILEAIHTLSEVDTKDVEPTASVTFQPSGPRPDVVTAHLGVDKALANAPARVGSSFAVPKIIE